jgi:hypothetical protein
MRLWRPAAWQRVVALAPLLLVLVSLPTQVLVRCRMDGRVRAACCCPRGEAGANRLAGPGVEAPDCCDRIVARQEAVRSTVAAQTEIAPRLAVVITALPALAAPRPRAPAPRARSGHPPGERPPLLLLKQAFLI